MDRSRQPPSSSGCWNKLTRWQSAKPVSTTFVNGSIGRSQRAAFRDQLELARQFSLPVVVHMRGDVEGEIVATLEEFPDVRIVFHSFDGSPELARLRVEAEAICSALAD